LRGKCAVGHGSVSSSRRELLPLESHERGSRYLQSAEQHLSFDVSEVSNATHARIHSSPATWRHEVVKCTPPNLLQLLSGSSLKEPVQLRFSSNQRAESMGSNIDPALTRSTPKGDGKPMAKKQTSTLRSKLAPLPQHSNACTSE